MLSFIAFSYKACLISNRAFALNAGIAGAKSVLGVDASELAVEQARENAELNGLSDIVKFKCCDVFELLPELEASGEKFDVIILDPPAFTKSRSSIKNAAIILTPNSINQEVPTETAPAYICYVNGVKVEDDKVAYAEANRILGSLSEDVQLAMAEVNRLTHYTIAK